MQQFGDSCMIYLPIGKVPNAEWVMLRTSVCIFVIETKVILPLFEKQKRQVKKAATVVRNKHCKLLYFVIDLGYDAL